MQKLIPPFLLIISVVVMFFLHFLIPFQIVFFSPYNYFGIILIISGLTIAKKVGCYFSKVDTEIHTFKKPRQLIINGLFRYSRNPIYFGFVLILLGLNIVLGSLTPLVVVLLFIVATNFWYITFEEKNMEKIFGQDYINYKKKVRRWI